MHVAFSRVDILARQRAKIDLSTELASSVMYAGFTQVYPDVLRR